MSAKTIFALASGFGRCGVSIVRLSGPHCMNVYKGLTKRSNEPPPRLLHPVRLYAANELLDNAMAVYFPQPKSFTGEDVLELHLHGAPIIVSQIYQQLNSHDGVRLANPGEFSERAFHNSKLGLQDVEGLADLLAAETDLQRKQALWLLNGGARLKVMEWRRELIEILASVEAYIDFAEDENIESNLIDIVNERLVKLEAELANALQSNVGERIRSGFTLVIAGKPNAGKSSLFNELVGRRAAIVSEVAGTTRDVLQCDVDVGGYPVRLLDTAGIRDCEGDVVEREGVQRAMEATSSADLVIHLVDPSDGNDDLDLPKNLNCDILTVYNKADLFADNEESKLWISCKTKYGIDRLLEAIRSRLINHQQSTSKDMPVITRERHRHHLSACLKFCKAALETSDLVTKAERLRQAARECGRVSGEVDVEEILDSLFKTFCIGK